MATGDIKGNVAQLERSLRHLKYPAAVDEVGLMLGDPLASLPILNFVLLKYSRHVAAYVLAAGVELQAKTDEGFVKGAFRLCRDHLGIRTVLTPTQFLEQGYAERKVLLLCDVVKAARELHAAGFKQERAKLQASFKQSPARMQQLSASPNPKVEWGGVSSNTRLRRLPDTSATDASQSIFAPAGSVEKHKSPASKVASPALVRVSQQLQGTSSPASAGTTKAWAACYTSPSHDQLVAAGLMPLSSWRPQAADKPAADTAAAAQGRAAGAAGATRSSIGQQQQQQRYPAGNRTGGGRDAVTRRADQHRQQHVAAATNEGEQELQQESHWTQPAGTAAPGQLSPAVALPQQQVWVPLQQQVNQQQQELDSEWHVGPQQWLPVQQLQHPPARTCLWPRQQDGAGGPQPQQDEHEPCRRLPPVPVLQKHGSSSGGQGPQRQDDAPKLQQQGHTQQDHHQQQQQASVDGMQQAGFSKAEGGHRADLPHGQQPCQDGIQHMQPLPSTPQQHGSPGRSPVLSKAEGRVSSHQQQQQQQHQQQQRPQGPHSHGQQQQQLQPDHHGPGEAQQQQQQQQQDHEELLLVQEEQQLSLIDAQQAITQLQEALACAEAQLQEHRCAAGRFEEAVCARITLMEGRLKLMEAQVASSSSGCCPVCHARQASGAAAATPKAAGKLTGTAGAAAAAGAKTYHQTNQESWLRQSPLKSPAHALVSAAAGGINWRAAASAAASAVVAGLSSSPHPAWRSPGAAAAPVSVGEGARQQLYASPQPGRAAAGSAATAGAAVTQPVLVCRTNAQGDGSIPVHRQAVTETTATCTSLLTGTHGADVAPDNTSIPKGAPSSTSRLIDQLASRAAEAQRLLQSLQ